MPLNIVYIDRMLGSTKRPRYAFSTQSNSAVGLPRSNRLLPKCVDVDRYLVDGVATEHAIMHHEKYIVICVATLNGWQNLKKVGKQLYNLVELCEWWQKGGKIDLDQCQSQSCGNRQVVITCFLLPLVAHSVVEMTNLPPQKCQKPKSGEGLATSCH